MCSTHDPICGHLKQYNNNYSEGFCSVELKEVSSCADTSLKKFAENSRNFSSRKFSSNVRIAILKMNNLLRFTSRALFAENLFYAFGCSWEIFFYFCLHSLFIERNFPRIFLQNFQPSNSFFARNWEERKMCIKKWMWMPWFRGCISDKLCIKKGFSVDEYLKLCFSFHALYRLHKRRRKLNFTRARDIISKMLLFLIKLLVWILG